MASLLPPSTPDVPLATPPLSSVLNPPPNTNTPPIPPATPSKNDTSTTPTTSPPAPPASDSPPPSSSPPSPAVVASPPPLASASSPPPDASSPPPPVLSTPPQQSPPPPAQSPPPTQSPPPPAQSPPPAESPSPPTITSPPPSSSPPPPSRTSPPPPPQESPATPPPQDSPSPPPPPQKSSPPPKASPSPPPPPAETTPPTATPSAPPPTTHSPPPPIDSSPPPSAIPPPPHAISPPPPDSASSPPSSSVIPTSPSPPAPPPPRKAISPPNIQRHSPPPPKPSDGSPSGLPVILGVTAVVGVFFLTCFVVFIWCLKTKRKRRDDAYSGGGMYGHPQFTPTSSVKSDQQLIGVYTSPPESGFSYGSSGLVGGGGNSSPPKGGTGLSSSNSSFNYEELAAATNGFATENILGEGGFGCVYKGTLPDGRVIAVKQLKSGGGQGEREFRAEVETISRIHHRHLVSLVGYCIHGYQRLLVYAFVANGNLEHHLHGKNVPVMSWETRMKIAIGAARGLAYLHEDCHPRIIHRDIKSANILIDDNFEAQVADFGLAKLAVDTHTHVSTRVMGTFGYLAPEYAASGKLTDKSDVYSFGVVLLELVTGRKPVDISQPIGEESLVEWARPIFSRVLEEGNFFDVVDSRLENNFNEAEMFRMIEAAGACVRHSSNRRPKMGQVVRALETNSATSDLNNGFKPGQSMMFNAGQQSSDIRRFRQMAFGSKEFSTEYSDGVSDNGTDRYSSEFKRDFENRHTRQYSTDSQRNRDYDRQSRQYSNDDIPRNRDFEYRQSRQHNPDFQRNRDFDSKPSRQSGMRAESSFPYAPDSPSSSVESETLPIHRYRSYQKETSERSSDEVPVGFKKENLAGR